jgi:hypothetical protein
MPFYASQTVEEQNARTNRFIRIATSITLALVLAIVVVSLILQVKATVILIHATDGGAKKRAANVVSSLAVENDCRARRAFVGLPSPANPALSCALQTPVEVYPGEGSR